MPGDFEKKSPFGGFHIALGVLFWKGLRGE